MTQDKPDPLIGSGASYDDLCADQILEYLRRSNAPLDRFFTRWVLPTRNQQTNEDDIDMWLELEDIKQSTADLMTQIAKTNGHIPSDDNRKLFDYDHALRDCLQDAEAQLAIFEEMTTEDRVRRHMHERARALLEYVQRQEQATRAIELLDKHLAHIESRYDEERSFEIDMVIEQIRSSRLEYGDRVKAAPPQPMPYDQWLDTTRQYLARRVRRLRHAVKVDKERKDKVYRRSVILQDRINSVYGELPSIEELEIAAGIVAGITNDD